MLKKRGNSLLAASLTAFVAVTSARADYSDCRTCHYATTPDGSAPDFTAHFVDPGHHPVRVSYPVRAEYHQPPNAISGIMFFDRNGNNLPDPDEIQIFSSSTINGTGGTTTRAKGKTKNTATTDTWLIDCASCHIEHGLTPPDPSHAVDYVRDAASGHRICVTCHNL